MLKSLIRFLFILLLSNTVGAQTSWKDSTQIDSVYVSRVVKLINDYKSCVEYSDEIEERLITAREILSRSINERNEYKRLYEEVDIALKDMNERKAKLEKKLKRTRRIGIFMGGFFGLVAIIEGLILML